MTEQRPGTLGGQRALVTGASSGIGAAIAKGLAAAGAAVVVNYSRDEAGAARTVSEIEAGGGRAFGVRADVSREDDVVAMMRQSIETLGSIDILVNNSGIQKDAAFVDMSLADTAAWDTPEAERKLLRLIPYGRVGDPVDVARAAAWLASDDSDYVTGATLYVDGGMTLFPEFRFGG